MNQVKIFENIVFEGIGTIDQIALPNVFEKKNRRQPIAVDIEV
jgi:hypothetical protein